MNRITRWLLSRPLAHLSSTRSFKKTTSQFAKPNIEHLEDRVVPARPYPLSFIYVGAETGAPPIVQGYNADTGALNFERTVYEAGFSGGVNVATADISQDHYPDLIVAPGAGGGPRVRVLDGITGNEIAGPLGNFWAYDPTFTGGVQVAAGDVNGDGVPDIITAAGAGGGPHVKVFDGRTGTVIQSFFAYDPDFTGGVSVAAADFTGNGRANIVVGAGYGGGPHVKIYDAMTAQTISGPLGSFFAFDPSTRSGVNVGTDFYTGDVTGDGRADVLVGTGKGQTPEVKVIDGVSAKVARDFLAYDATMTAGVRPASAYVNDDIYADIVVGTQQGVETKVRVFDGQTTAQLPGAQGEYLPFGPGSLRGVNIAASNDPPLSGVFFYTVGCEPDDNHYQIIEGHSVYISVYVWTSSTNPTPTGTYTLTADVGGTDYDLGTQTLTATPSNYGKAMFVVPGVFPVGSVSFTASYSGDANYNPLTGTFGYEAMALPVRNRPAEGCSDCSQILGNAAGAGTGGPSLQGSGGVLVGSGDVAVRRQDIAAGGGGGLSQSWSWSNTNSGTDYTDGISGNGARTSFPRLLDSGYCAVYLVCDCVTSEVFDESSMTYKSRFSSSNLLTHDDMTDEFTMTDGRGARLVFYDFSSGTPYGRSGQLKSYTDPAGNVMTVTSWSSAGWPLTTSWTDSTGASPVTETMSYGYDSSGLLDTVTQERQVGSGSLAVIREADYTYYGYSSNGSSGDLQFATVKDAASQTLSTTYYRYYVPSYSSYGSYSTGMKYEFGPTAYARLVADLGSSVDSLTDAQVAPYADRYFEYDSAGRVTKVVASGEGCSTCSGGQGTYTYTYTSNSGPNFPNFWKMKTVETLPDGNTNTFYTNGSGQVMLKVYTDTTTTQSWITSYVYDDAGRLIQEAEPSAVTGYDDSYPDLVHYVSGNAAYISDSTGLVMTDTYATATTATDSTAGDVADRLKQVSIRQGETGTAVPQSASQYLRRTDLSASTIYVPATSTQYRNNDGTGAQTTTASYTWHGSTLQPESITTTLPTVTSAQNGSNSATSTTTVFDSYGRAIWSKDAAGFLTYAEYDHATGAAVKQITDVDTTQTSTFASLPSGWTTPTGGGLHLTTTYEVDSLGRTTKMTSPIGRVDYTVYDDVNHSVRSYPAWDSTTNTPTGPITVSRDDRANGYTETLTMSATPTVSGGRPTGTETISNIESLSRSYRNTAGQVVYSDSYFNLSGLTYSTSTSLGTINTNFYRTYQDYNKQGRPNRSVTPAGTITRTEYDGLNRPISMWVGTDDTPTTGYWSTTNLTGTDMVKVKEYDYDNGGVGDGNITQVTDYPGGGATPRVTQMFYDWRNRQVVVKSGVETSESTSVNRPISYTSYDNLNEVIQTQVYDGDGVTISSSGGVPTAPSSSLLRAQSTTTYDELGRAYHQSQYSVDPSSGTVSTSALNTNTWYDSRGNVIKISSPGGLVQKTAYDGAGRTVVSYITDGSGDSGYSDAGNVTGDAVLNQTETTYDAKGNVLLTTTRDRFHNDTGTGALGTPTTGVHARISYMAAYYDLADRQTASVDVGTNGGTAYTRPSTVPTRSDSTLVTSEIYDSAGRLYETTDPTGLKSRTYSDALGRTTKTIANYVDGVPSNSDDKTTEYTYGPAGMTNLIAHLAGGSSQTTAWVYGVTTASGSSVNSNDIVGATQWPDPTTGAASSSQQATLLVNALGQPLVSTDRNGSTHTLTYDVLGRVISDAVTTLGTGVDGSVRRVETAYDSQGNPYLLTNYDAASGGSIVTQMQRAYNGLGQLTQEWQSHSGAVNTSTTPSVQYSYSTLDSNNRSRLTSMTYPSGYVLTYNYSTGLNDTISRLSSLSDSTGTLESYDYLGLGTVVQRSHPQPGVNLTYIGTGTGSGGDQYVGLDSFGRIVDQNWTNGTTSTDRFTYTHDRDGNRLTKGNSVNTAFNENYSYDGLNQLTGFTRGTHTQSWNYDALGNWNSVTTDGSTQTRTANQQNEITSISGATTPTYDANGNMTTDETGKQFVYDAWNRLKVVKDSSGTVLKNYTYDGLNHRVAETASGTTTDLYYSVQWQVLEERVGGSAKYRYVWSPVYVDAMMIRSRLDTGERLWVQQDANFNVTSITNNSGNVAERYAYDPYGSVVVLNASWSALSGSVYNWQYLHQGGRLDAVSGLYNFRNREYSPTLEPVMNLNRVATI